MRQSRILCVCGGGEEIEQGEGGRVHFTTIVNLHTHTRIVMLFSSLHTH